MADRPQILTYVVNNGIATINGELLPPPSFEAFAFSFGKVNPLGKIQLKGTNNLIDLFEVSSTFGGEVLIFDEVFLQFIGEASVPVTSYTIANGRVYGGEQVLIFPFGVLGVTIPGITLDGETLVNVKDIAGNTIATITLTDWDSLTGGGVTTTTTTAGICFEQQYTLTNLTIIPQSFSYSTCETIKTDVLDPLEERLLCATEEPIPQNPGSISVSLPGSICT